MALNFGSVLMAIACTSLKNKEQVKMPEDNKMPLLINMSTNVKEAAQQKSPIKEEAFCRKLTNETKEGNIY